MNRGRILAILALACGAVAPAPAQNLIMKNGKTITAKALRRQGDQIIATVEVPAAEAGKPANTGELGYPLAQIERLDFPKPAILESGADLLASGKGEDVLRQLEPVVTFYTGFRDAPGSWWPESALLKAQTLAALGRDTEANLLANQILQSPGSDPEIARAADVLIALGRSQKGVPPGAVETAERALKESRRPFTRAAASVIMGQRLLEKKDWEDALLSYLRVAVFSPEEKVLLCRATIGAGRAWLAMDDFESAREAFKSVIETAGQSPESKTAETELENVARREKALAPPK